MGIDWFKYRKCPCGGLMVADQTWNGGRYVKKRDFCGTCGKTAGQLPDRQQLAAGEHLEEERDYDE